MGVKLADGKIKDACLDKVEPGERFFVLRAQDRLAPDLIRLWAAEAERFGRIDAAKLQEARDCADEMERWPTRKFPD